MTDAKHRLASLQLAIMQVLWEVKEATVAEIRDALAADDRPLAHTTIATMLAKMERKGQVTHVADGRAYRYRPAIRQDQVSSSMVNDLVDRLFAGNVAEMVTQLLDGAAVSPEELARLKQLIARKEQEAKRKGRTV